MKFKRTIAGIGGLWEFRVFRCGLPSIGGLCSHLLVVFTFSFLHSFIFMLMGCSGGQIDGPEAPGSEPQSAAQTAIAFLTDLSEAQAVTRSEPLETYATSFKVWGHKNMSFDEGTSTYGTLQTVFQGYTVNWEANTAATTASNTHDWEYVGQQEAGDPDQTIKYWDWSAKAYRFFGATKYEGTPPATLVENKTYGTYKTYTTHEAYEITTLVDASQELDGEGKIDLTATATKMADAPYISRLWFSTNELPTYGDKRYGQPVVLEFIKPFARVRFMFTYVYPREGIKLENKSFKPTDGSSIVRKGAITIQYPLSGTAIRESLVSAAADGTNPEALAAFTEDWDPEDDSKVYTKTDNGWYTVLPNNSQGSYTLTVDINGAARTASVPAQFMQWQPGYQYTYVFKITEEGGVEIDLVMSAFTEWKSDIRTTHEVYNW